MTEEPFYLRPLRFLLWFVIRHWKCIIMCHCVSYVFKIFNHRTWPDILHVFRGEQGFFFFFLLLLCLPFFFPTWVIYSKERETHSLSLCHASLSPPVAWINNASDSLSSLKRLNLWPWPDNIKCVCHLSSGFCHTSVETQKLKDREWV